jgi:hypothetical protein
MKNQFNLWEFARKHNLLIFSGLVIALVHTTSFYFSLESTSEKWVSFFSALLLEAMIAFFAYFGSRSSTPIAARGVAIFLGLAMIGISGYLQQIYYTKAGNDTITSWLFGYLIPISIAGISIFEGLMNLGTEKQLTLQDLIASNDNLRLELMQQKQLTAALEQELEAARIEPSALAPKAIAGRFEITPEILQAFQYKANPTNKMTWEQLAAATGLNWNKARYEYQKWLSSLEQVTDDLSVQD